MSIFNTTPTSVQIVNATGATLLYGVESKSGNVGGGEVNVAFQPLPIGVNSFGLTATRGVTPMYSIAKTKTGGVQQYMYTGALTGSLTLQTVFGPAVKLRQFMQKIANPCNVMAFQLTPNIKNCDNTGAPESILVSGCVWSQFNYTLQIGQGGIATISLPLTFSINDVDIKKV